MSRFVGGSGVNSDSSDNTQLTASFSLREEEKEDDDEEESSEDEEEEE